MKKQNNILANNYKKKKIKNKLVHLLSHNNKINKIFLFYFINN